MDFDNVVKLLTSLLGAGGAATLVVKGLQSRSDRRRSREEASRASRIRSIWSRMIDTTNTLRHAVQKSGACRVLIIKSENNGGVPSMSNPTAVTVLYDATDGKTRSLAGKWNKVRPDHQYSELLGRLTAQDSGVHLVTEAMESGDLKTLYEADGCAQAWVYRLAANETAMCYLSFNFPHAEDLTSRQQECIRETRMKFRTLVRELDSEFHRAPI